MLYLRLKKNGDFLKLFKKGTRVYSKLLTVVYCPARGKTVMGISLSKKHGKAVKRNLIKRRIRAAFANNISLLKKPCSIVIMPKVSESYSYKEIEKSLLQCFKRINGSE